MAVKFEIISVPETTTTSESTTVEVITDNLLAVIKEKLEQMKSRPDVDPMLLKMLNDTIFTPKGKELELLNIMMQMVEKLQKQTTESNFITKGKINVTSKKWKNLNIRAIFY